MGNIPGQPTPEELRWRRSVCDPEKAQKNLRRQYGLLGLWSTIATGWIMLVVLRIVSFGWAPVIVLAAGYLNFTFGILRIKRTTTNQGGEVSRPE